MIPDLVITRTSQSRLHEVDFDQLAFGRVFSDHMFSMDYRDGRWRNPSIMPYQPIMLDPGAAMLHYGQTVFEGLKAFRGVDGVARVFRPDANAKRMTESARRLCMPPVDEGLFVEAIQALVELDHSWMPRQPGQALYVRPLLIGTEAHLDVRPDTTYRFMIMTTPVGAYFQQGGRGISIRAEDQYTRAAASGGLGYAKTAANYAAGMFALDESRKAGFDQVLWLDGNEHRYVEEMGAMNIFFRLEDRVITPALTGSILPGVTRDSVIQLLRDHQVTVEKRRIAIGEVMEALRDGRMAEVFAVGTAAVISPVAGIHYRGEALQVRGAPRSLTTQLYDEITGIQSGRLPDTHGWCVRVPLPIPETAAAQAARR